MTCNQLNIIIADDDADDQLLIKEAIRHYAREAELISVTDGAELLKWVTQVSEDRVQKTKPDIIILDLNMPRMDGITALTKIKAIEYCRDIPVYILTTSKDEEDKRRCSELGARRFFTKPSGFGSLQASIKTIIGDVKPENKVTQYEQ